MENHCFLTSLGRVFGRLWDVLPRLGSLLDHLGDILGNRGAVLEAFWKGLGLFWNQSGGDLAMRYGLAAAVRRVCVGL